MALIDASTRQSIIGAILLVGLFISCLEVRGVHSIGVCNGRLGNNLPSEQEVVNFYKRNGIDKMRIYDPNQATLQALSGSNIGLMLGVPNENLQALADPSAAANWVQTNIVAHSPAVSFRYIAVGNEIKPNDAAAQFVLPAMQNIYKAIVSANLNIKVSTAIEPSLLGTSYPPSAGSFSASSASYINPIVQFLVKTGAPLLANVYTYFSYISGTQDIKLDYALLNSPEVVVKDNNLKYKNLLDATVDALYSALEKAGGSSLEIVVSETGWPSAGGAAATFDNSATYYSNVLNHVQSGTPKRPERLIETYLFAMFDENLKGPAETERHLGLFYPNEEPKYQLRFS